MRFILHQDIEKYFKRCLAFDYLQLPLNLAFPSDIMISHSLLKQALISLTSSLKRAIFIVFFRTCSSLFIYLFIFYKLVIIWVETSPKPVLFVNHIECFVNYITVVNQSEELIEIFLSKLIYKEDAFKDWNFFPVFFPFNQTKICLAARFIKPSKYAKFYWHL